MTLVDESNFNEFVKKDLVLIMFWSAWCGPCIETNYLISLNQDFPNLSIGRINAEENQTLADTCDVLVMPTYIILKNNIKIKHIIGIQTRDSLKKILNQIL